MDGGLTDTSLDTYKRMFTEARDLTQTARSSAKKHRRYYDGKIDPTLDRELRRKRQPNFVINRVRPGVEGMVGVVERGKTDPRAYPRTPQDENASEVATDTLRYVTDQNRWHQNKLKAFRNFLVEGVAAVIVEVDERLEVRIRRGRYEAFFYDPYSREPDFSDASYMGFAEWQYQDDAIAAYPEHQAAILHAVANGDTGDAQWGDRPDDQSTLWADPRRKRLLMVEMYAKRGGTWMKCVFIGSLKLEEGPSPFLDDDSRPMNPIEAMSAYVDDDNNRYGVVADMVGPQDEINTYRRKGAHLATFRQLQETDPSSAGADPEEARREASRADGVIPSGWNIVPTTDKFSMDMSLLTEAKSEIERIGPNPAILGRQGESQSGRAGLIRQQAGLTELAHLYGALEDWELRVFRQVWSRVRQYWTEPKFIRVTDDENAVKFIQINKPVYGEPAPVIDQLTGLPKYDPYTRQIVMAPQLIGMENAVAEMGVDIIVDSTPDTANVQQEQFQALVELAKVGGLGQNPGPILLRNSSLPKKREIIEALEKEQQQAQQPPPEMQAAIQLKMRQASAEIGKTEAQAQQAQANALKTMGEAQAAEMQSAWLGQSGY